MTEGPWIITGAAGFIGAHTTARLLAEGAEVIGVDSFSDYYDPAYKADRVAALIPDAELVRMDLSEPGAFVELCEARRPAGIIHLAAQAGVRTGLTRPRDYVRDNLQAFVEVLEGARHSEVGHLIYASSSSVYGATSPMPFEAANPADRPVSLYAATKRSNELLAHSYAHLFGIPTTGLRFFTVYGSWGRPDMAYTIFAKAIREGGTIRINGDGSAVRDLTYVDDVVESLVRLRERPPAPDPTWHTGLGDESVSVAPWRVMNIGHGGQITVLELVELLEKFLGGKANLEFGPGVPGDVPSTQADSTPLGDLVGYQPRWTVEAGIEAYCAWLDEVRGAP